MTGSAEPSLPPERIRDFILAHTRLRPVPHAPEIVLHVADESLELWQKTEAELDRIGLPAPFWAFAWAGGQALARYLLDHRQSIAGCRVLDVGTGSGLVGIAAALAGGTPVIACDIDSFAEQAVALNSEANGVYLEVFTRDPLDDLTPAGQRYDLIVAGDLFYERETANRTLAFLRRHAALGTKVLIGDPGRAYLPRQELHQLCGYTIAVTRELEDADMRRVAVWTLESSPTV